MFKHRVLRLYKMPEKIRHFIFSIILFDNMNLYISNELLLCDDFTSRGAANEVFE